MQIERLQFMDDAALTEDGMRVGVTLCGKTQWARNALQAEILRQVLQKPRNPETYAAELAREQNRPLGSADMTLHLLDFILDFKDFLQSR